jgi:hypothetical protein
MSAATPPRPAARLAADIARPLPLSDPARAALAPALTARQFFDALVAADLPDDAVRFLAAALPKREAVWWGCVCVRSAPALVADPVHLKALVAAEQWVKDPTEANRRAAEAAAEAAGPDNPPGCLASAAFWSGGSLTPAGQPPVPPRDDLTGQAVAGAVLLAAAHDPSATAAARRQFLTVGQQVAAGQERW